MCDERGTQGNHNGAETIKHYVNMPYIYMCIASKLVLCVFADVGSVLMRLVCLDA